MVRKSSEERREEILRAAGAVVLARGFSRVSARELAGEIGVSAGLLHHYFSSMDEIRGAAVALFAEEDVAQLEEAVDPTAEPLQRLDQVLRFFAPVPDDRAWNLWVDAWNESRHTTEMQDPVRRLNQRSLDLIADVVADGVATGRFASDDPRASALVIGAMMDGLVIQVVVLHAVSHDEGLAVLRRTAELELGLPPGTLAGRVVRPPSPRRVRTTMARTRTVRRASSATRPG